MRLNRCRVFIAVAVVLVFLPFSFPARAQNRPPNPGLRALVRYANVSRCDPAPGHGPDVSLMIRALPENRAEASLVDSCGSWLTEAPPSSSLRPVAPAPPADADLPGNGDSAVAELQEFGTSGETIEQARAEVLDVLASDNKCSAWFRRFVPNPADTFRTLHFHLDVASSRNILKTQDRSGRWLFRQPYMAKTYENAGEGATITINRFGAFFMSAGQILIVPFDGGPSGLDVQHLLRVDYYTGDTPQARMLILLHEFGHILGTLPHDGYGQDAGWKSARNTELVLHYCRKQVDAAGSHHHGETPGKITSQ